MSITFNHQVFMRKYDKNKNQGFTLVELMITVLILSILLGIGLPSFLSSFDEKRLITATEQVYGHLQQARIESISRSNDVTVTFKESGTSWTYGYTEGSAACDTTKTAPTDTGACFIEIDDGDGVAGQDADKVLKRFVGNDFTDVTMTISGFTNPDNPNQITFSPLRGLADAGTITLKSGLLKELKIKVSPLGMIKVCAPTGSSVGMYSADSSC